MPYWNQGGASRRCWPGVSATRSRRPGRISGPVTAAAFGVAPGRFPDVGPATAPQGFGACELDGGMLAGKPRHGRGGRVRYAYWS